MNPQIEQELKDDFRKFLIYVWRVLGLPRPTAVQLDIAYWLQHGEDRMVIEAFRGIGKSWITSTFVVWCLWRDPEMKILVVSASKDRSDSFSTFTKRLLHDVPVVKHLLPREDQRNSNVAFDVGPCKAAHAPSVKSVGITGQMTGSRANLIIPDDIETPKNSMTQLQREKLSELVKEFDAILNPGGRILYLGTPQCEMSIYNTLGERGYRIRIWPVRYPTEAQVKQYGEKLASWVKTRLEANPLCVGESTEPTRFPEEELEVRAASYGRSGFALQFMLDTTLSDAEKYPLKMGDLVVLDLDKDIGPVKVSWACSPELIVQGLPNVGFTGDRIYRPMYVADKFEPYQGAVLVIDPSGRGADETAYCVIKMLYGQLFLLDAGGLKDGYSETTLTKLANIAKDHKVTQVLIESNFGDGMFAALLSPYLLKFYPCGIEEVRHSIVKEKRIIDTLEPVMNQHRLVVDRRLIEKDYKEAPAPAYSLFWQLTRMTREKGALKHDDRIDVLAIGVAYWIEHMRKDVEQNEQEHKETMLERELEKFRRHIFGNNPVGSQFTGLARDTRFGQQPRVTGGVRRIQLR